jgi:hypothetical protein
MVGQLYPENQLYPTGIQLERPLARALRETKSRRLMVECVVGLVSIVALGAYQLHTVTKRQEELWRAGCVSYCGRTVQLEKGESNDRRADCIVACMDVGWEAAILTEHPKN